ncbi:MAG: glutathione S-transferase [Ponticaulis sp.]|nr:glutathione S-transferase [Ponticaulis sp.]
MLKLYGEGRGVRVAWLLEEMGIPYELRSVDLLNDLEKDTEFLTVNPGGFIPALIDGDVTMVESVAIMQYIIARYGPTGLAPDPSDPAFATYLQFLHLGEAGLATLVNVTVATRILAPPDEQENFGSQHAIRSFRNRMKLVKRQLETSLFIAGDKFTAADISVSYALALAKRGAGLPLGEPETSYLKRMEARPAFQRMLNTFTGTKKFYESVPLDA